MKMQFVWGGVVWRGWVVRTALPRDRPQIRLFPSPAPIFFLSSLTLEVFSWNFGGVFEGRDPPMCTFGLSKRAHLRVPALQKHHQNSTRRPPEKERKNENGCGKGKNKRNFGPPTLRGPALRGPPFGAQQYPCPKFLMPQPNWV